MEDESNSLLDTDLVLKPMLDLAQSSVNSNASMLRTVVLKAISDPKIFCGFDEIKSILQPGLSSAGAEGEVISQTLDLFSYGSFGDYQKETTSGSTSGSFLALSATHVFKLRQLTLLSLVQTACSGGDENASAKANSGGCLISYNTLASGLGFADDSSNNKPLDHAILRQVEELVLSCVYARVLVGQLCQKSAAFVVSSRHGPPCRTRDVPLSQGAAMLAMLQQFHHGRLQEAKNIQDKRQQEVQKDMDHIHSHHQAVLERTKKAEMTSLGHNSHHHNPVLIGGGGGGVAVRGWSEGGQQERRSSDVGGSARGSSRRQSKRSRG